MHRSGTSLVAGLLHNLGVVMGSENTFRPKPTEHNAKGFYENVEFRRLNDDILKFSRYDVKSWHTDIPTIKSNKPLRKRMSGIVDQYNSRYKVWGFKDPRTCLTWRQWKPFLPSDTKIVYVYRNPVSVAKSLQHRGNIKNLETGLVLWSEYNERALPIAEHFETRFINYEDVLSGEVLPDVNNLIDKNLFHAAPGGIPDCCLTTWKKLQP